MRRREGGLHFHKSWPSCNIYLLMRDNSVLSFENIKAIDFQPLKRKKDLLVRNYELLQSHYLGGVDVLDQHGHYQDNTFCSCIVNEHDSVCVFKNPSPIWEWYTRCTFCNVLPIDLHILNKLICIYIISCSFCAYSFVLICICSPKLLRELIENFQLQASA